MDEQTRQLFVQGVAVQTRLAQSGVSGNDYIPQDLRLKMCKGPFPHGEGEDVRGTIDATIVSVQPMHPDIIDDEHAQVTILTCEGREQLQQCLSQRPGVDRDGLLLIPTADGHWCFASAA
jgi:hypothetical protein